MAYGEAHTDAASKDKFSFRSFGAHFVEIGWDPTVSRLRVHRVVSAIDVGQIVNATTAANQVEGAIAMGIGHVRGHRIRPSYRHAGQQ
jgi:xanthine dehydrogenase YagR molybdenum-binding subunit